MLGSMHVTKLLSWTGSSQQAAETEVWSGMQQSYIHFDATSKNIDTSAIACQRCR